MTATAAPDTLPQHEALRRIRDQINTGELASHGLLLSPNELARRLGIDAELVKLALGELEAEGTVWRETGAVDGECLHPSHDPMQVIEARLCIEPTLASLCAQRATTEEVNELLGLLSAAEREPDDDTWDASLHRTIATRARSSALLEAFTVLEEARASPGWQVALARARTSEHRQLYRGQHVAIVEAVCDRDPAGARDAMTEHLEMIKRHMALAIGPR